MPAASVTSTGRREQRRTPHLPKTVPDIGAEIVNPSHSAHLESLLFPAQRIAEVHTCATPGIGRRHAGCHQRIDVRVEMRSPLRLHVRFESSPAKER